jgi:hypothetical protein
MKYKILIIWHFLRWLQGPCMIVDGLCLVLSFGFYCPETSLRAMTWYLDYSEIHSDTILK